MNLHVCGGKIQAVCMFTDMLACKMFLICFMLACPAGATLVLFCCEKVQEIYTGLFKQSWKEADYTRTTYYQTKVARRFLPDAVDWFNAKSILLKDVPANERWFTITKESTNDNLIPQIHGDP